MSHVSHELLEEFPGKHEKLHELKLSNGHFLKLHDEYHELNREIHRIESGVAPTSDEVLENLKKKRLVLLDDISAMLG